MIRRINVFYFFIAILIIFSSCKGTQNATTAKPKKNSPKYTLYAAKKEAFDFKTLSVSGKVYTSFPEMGSVSLNYKLNMKSDSLIWVRISKLGFEAARAKISRDSVWVLDRMQNVLMVSDFSLLESYIGFQADFELLEDIILGNYNPVPADLTVQDKKADPQIFYGAEGATDFYYSIRTTDFKLGGIEVKNEMGNQHARVEYGDFKKVAEQLMAHKGSIEVLAPQGSSLKFQHNKVNFNPSNVTFKFRIPDNYKRVVPN